MHRHIYNSLYTNMQKHAHTHAHTHTHMHTYTHTHTHTHTHTRTHTHTHTTQCMHTGTRTCLAAVIHKGSPPSHQWAWNCSGFVPIRNDSFRVTSYMSFPVMPCDSVWRPGQTEGCIRLIEILHLGVVKTGTAQIWTWLQHPLSGWAKWLKPGH